MGIVAIVGSSRGGSWSSCRENTKHARILKIQKHWTCGQSASLGIIFCNTPRKCSRPHHMAALCIPTLQPPQPTCLMLVAWCLNTGTPIHEEFHKGRPKAASLCGWVWRVYTHLVSGIKQSNYKIKTLLRYEAMGLWIHISLLTSNSKRVLDQCVNIRHNCPVHVDTYLRHQ